MAHGLMYVTEKTEVDADSDGMTIKIKSGDDTFAFRFTRHAGTALEQRIKQTAWAMHCAPDAEVIRLKPKKKGAR